MNDTEILDWLQDNLVGLWQNCNDTYTMACLDGKVVAPSLRECVEIAVKGLK